MKQLFLINYLSVLFRAFLKLKTTCFLCEVSITLYYS